MKADPRRARGQKKMAQIAQVPVIDPPDDFVATTIDRVFGELWQRPGLSDRERRLITLAVIGSRGLEFEGKTHIRGALKTGDLSPADMIELILQVAHYGGWPHASVLYSNLLAVCTELGLEVPGPGEGD